MRLAYVIPRFPCLSETFVSAEVERVVAAGIDTRICSFERPTRTDTNLLTAAVTRLSHATTYLSTRSVTATTLLRPGAALRLRRDNRAMHDAATAKPIAALRLARATALADWATRERITHLHAHWPYATQIAWLVNKLTKIPFSTSIHAHEVAHENGHFPQVFKTLSFATFCNRGAMNYLLKQLPAAAGAQSHLVYHGVDLSRFSPRPLPSFEAGLRIVTAGRLTATKGFDRLIRGCAQLRGQGVSTRLTILGRGAAETSLRDLSRELGFSEFLSMPGWVGHRDVKRYLTDAHIFALLADTTFHDGLPNVVLEAMACGRPILISRLPAADEAVSDGVEGFVVDRHEDPLAFAAAAGRIHRDHDLAARMGQAARSRVVRDHDADGQVLKLIELYRRRP